jgi:hypothetical protein
MMTKRKTVLQVLTDMRKLLDDPKHWTKHARALTATGTTPTDGVCGRNAYSFCLMGACERAAGGWDQQAYSETRRALTELTAIANCTGIVSFNDRYATKHADVLAFLDLGVQVAKMAEGRA